MGEGRGRGEEGRGEERGRERGPHPYKLLEHPPVIKF